jgi:hypothetical protein
VCELVSVELEEDRPVVNAVDGFVAEGVSDVGEDAPVDVVPVLGWVAFADFVCDAVGEFGWEVSHGLH